jgi:DNA-binding transcriptional LysR family regulator
LQELDWNDLRAFLAIAHAGSLSAAGRRLRLSQPTMGRRLRALEATLAARLFDRLPNGLALTARGAELLAAAEAMAASAAGLARRAAGAAPGIRQPVRVTATGSVSLFLTMHLAALAGACPAAQIAIAATRARLNLALGEAEIALRMKRPPDRGNLTTRRLGRLAFSLYASAEYCRNGDGGPDFRGAAFIGLPETARRPSQSRWLDDFAARHGGIVVCRLSEVSLRHRAAAQHAGIALLPCFLGDGDPGLVRLVEPPAELVEDVHLVLHDTVRPLPGVREVARTLRRLFHDEASALLGIERAAQAGASPGG